MGNEGILIVGGGGHARVIIEASQASGFIPVGILDGGVGVGTTVCGIEVLGDDSLAGEIFERGVHAAVVTILKDVPLRRRITEGLREIGYAFPTLLNAPAYVSPLAEIGDGATLLPGSVVNAEVRVGRFSTVNTGAVVEHQAVVGDWAHVAPHATLLGAVTVGAGAVIGGGATVLPGVRVGSDSIVGAGSVVISDVDEGVVVAGNPARVLRRR